MNTWCLIGAYMDLLLGQGSTNILVCWLENDGPWWSRIHGESWCPVDHECWSCRTTAVLDSENPQVGWLDNWIMWDLWVLGFCRVLCIVWKIMDLNSLGFISTGCENWAVDHVGPGFLENHLCAQVGWFDHWIMLDLWGLGFCGESLNKMDLDSLRFTVSPEYSMPKLGHPSSLM